MTHLLLGKKSILETESPTFILPTNNPNYNPSRCQMVVIRPA